MHSKEITVLLRVVLLAGLAGLYANCSKQSQDDLPPVVYICPMLKDAAVLEDHAGKCPECGMELKPVRIVRAYSCLNNTAFIQANPGKCITNGTDLVPITASMFWVCSKSPDKHELNPGTCADGSGRIQKFEPRLHGDHNPRHGGQLFMADDGWHHVEGTYPESGLLRVFFYDDWTRPLVPEGVSARVIVKDQSGKETGTAPLRAGDTGNFMDAHISKASMPLTISVAARFAANEAEKRFDFTFKEYSKDPGEPAGNTPTRQISAAKAPGVAAVSRDVQSPPGVTAVPVTDPTVLSPTNIIPTGTFQLEPIPSSAKDILAELDSRSRELSQKIEQRAPLGEYWVPALRTKDLALALLNDHQKEIPSSKRASAENAVGHLLRAAYAIDYFGDLGDFEKILSAHEEFKSAVNDLRNACASIN